MNDMSEARRPEAPDSPVTPVGINHIVLHVRDMEVSHKFWTEVLGFRQVGELKPTERRPNPPRMRFYSGIANGSLKHHDVALVENKDLPPLPVSSEFTMFGNPTAVNHIAITFPNREAWLAQLAYLQKKGVPFGRRVDHGMTHSLYIQSPDGYGVELLYDLPREVWEGDIDGALNYVADLPREGPAALEDKIEGLPVFTKA